MPLSRPPPTTVIQSEAMNPDTERSPSQTRVTVERPLREKPFAALWVTVPVAHEPRCFAQYRTAEAPLTPADESRAVGSQPVAARSAVNPLIVYFSSLANAMKRKPSASRCRAPSAPEL